MRGREQADGPWMCARRLVGVLAVVTSASCGQSRSLPSMGQADDSPTAAVTFSRQVDADVGAIVAGMAFAHGARAVVVRLPQ
jgi:hypothetical protein